MQSRRLWVQWLLVFFILLSSAISTHVSSIWLSLLIVVATALIIQGVRLIVQELRVRRETRRDRDS